MSSFFADAHAELKKYAPEIARMSPLLAKALPLFGISLHAANSEQQETGHDDSGAVTSVASTLTPGLANSPTLTDSTEVSETAIDGSHVDAAADALEPGATTASAIQALQSQPAPAPH